MASSKKEAAHWITYVLQACLRLAWALRSVSWALVRDHLHCTASGFCVHDASLDSVEHSRTKRVERSPRPLAAGRAAGSSWLGALLSCGHCCRSSSSRLRKHTHTYRATIVSKASICTRWVAGWHRTAVRRLEAAAERPHLASLALCAQASSRAFRWSLLIALLRTGQRLRFGLYLQTQQRANCIFYLELSFLAN